MRIPPQISGASIVAFGNFNPLILRPDWLNRKEIVVGADYESILIEVIHPEIVAFRVSWGEMRVDRERFQIAAVQEPLIRVHDFFVRCFQALPETPIRAVGINREIHFPAGNRAAYDRIGDMFVPKDFWADFLPPNEKGQRVGGLRSLIMEQAFITPQRKRVRLDGKEGHIQIHVENSLRQEVPFGIYVAVNDHYELRRADGEPLDGRNAQELVSERWDTSIRYAETWFDKIMGLTNGS
jgi:hypothetical protein